MFYIPIENKITEFQTHLDSHPRTILSARFGDGKSFFLNKAKEVLREKGYEFITVHPIHYQVSKNEDVFNLIKRDILYQMLIKGMIKEDYEISDSVAFSFFLQSKTADIIDEMLSFLSLINNDDSNIKSVLAAFTTHKLFKSLSQKFEAFTKEGSKDKAIATFLSNNLHDITIGNDAITTIIRENILEWEKKNQKKVVLIFEDMDRIDPEHLFRIMNILSAQMDNPYVLNTPKEEQTREDINQFGMYTILLVLHYENLKSIFFHFYGENTDFRGYLSKFSPRGYFRYSFSEERNKYIYNRIQEVTNLPLEVIQKFITPDMLKARDLRKIVDSFDNIDTQILPKAYIQIVSSPQKIICSAKMLRIAIIARRLDMSESSFINSCVSLLSTNCSQYMPYFAVSCIDLSIDKTKNLFIRTNGDGLIKTNFIRINESGDAEVSCAKYIGVTPSETLSFEELAMRLYDYISQ